MGQQTCLVHMVTTHTCTFANIHTEHKKKRGFEEHFLCFQRQFALLQTAIMKNKLIFFYSSRGMHTL